MGDRLSVLLMLSALLLAAIVGVITHESHDRYELDRGFPRGRIPTPLHSQEMLAEAPQPPPVIPTSIPSRMIEVVGTVYNAVPSQTDSSPMVTADGTDLAGLDLSKVRYCALSRDLLARWGGPLHYGQVVHVEGAGDLDGGWEVHDTMNKRFTNHIDFLVPATRKTGKWSTLVLTY
jgi:3D (Asp-Asp-Asp) domain-containing protein